MLLGHSEDHDLVVGKQILLDCTREGQTMQLRPIGRRVVHGEHVDVVDRRLRPGTFRVEARCGGHVEPFGRAYSLRIMYQHERRGAVAGTLDASRSVCLVAQNDVERRRAFVLRLFHQAERVVGTEDYRQRIRWRVSQRVGNRRRIGGDRNLQFLKRGVLVVVAGASIGTDPDITVRDRPLLRPFTHRLLEQRDRRHQIERPPPDARDRFRDAQRGKGLARATRHDQLAATLRLEAAGHVVERGLLMGAQAERLALYRQRFRCLADQVWPIDRPAGKIAEAEYGAGGGQWCDGLRRGGAPLVAGIDDDACGERFTGRGRDEGIEVRLRYSRARRVALALNGAIAACAFYRDEIDARIAAREPRLPLYPFGPQPDISEPIPVEWVLDEVRLHQPFEKVALLEF